MRLHHSLFCLLLATFGCGSKEPALWPVSGTVVFSDGTPATGIIEFTPQNSGPSARGRIDGDGSFVVQTAGQPGAIAGAHRVTIFRHILADGIPQHAGKHRSQLQSINARFANPATSGLVRTVETHANVFKIVIEH